MKNRTQENDDVIIFEYNSYKKYLKDLTINHYKVSELATIAGCHRTYFSQVLNGKAQLTIDHILNLADILKFNEVEKNYFLNLCFLGRASLIRTKDNLKKKLEQLRKIALSTPRNLKSSDSFHKLSPEKRYDYFSNYQVQQVHMITSIAKYQTAEAIAEKLKLPLNHVENILKQLVELDFIEKNGNKFSYKSSKNLEFSKEDPFFHSFQINWRLNAISEIKHENSFNRTYVFTLNKNDVPIFKSRLLKLIRKQMDFVHQSEPPEEMYCFNCDFFESN